MVEAADIREWRGHAVVDPDGHKIGELKAIDVDTSADLPAFGTVRTGTPGRHRLVFVPVAQAIVGPGYVKGAYDRKQVKDSPSISPKANRQRPTKRPSSSTTACPTREAPVANGN